MIEHAEPTEPWPRTGGPSVVLPEGMLFQPMPMDPEACAELERAKDYTAPAPEGQSRLGSFIEAAVNVAIGYGVALVSQWLVFPLFGINVSLSTNLWIGAWFTVISIVRSYILRRWFNARLHAVASRIAKHPPPRFQKHPPENVPGTSGNVPGTSGR